MTEPTAAADLLKQGLFHHRQGQLAEAMERYTQVLRIDPDNAEALYYCAVVACQEGQFEQGIGLAEKAIAAGPAEARMHNLIGKAQERLGRPLEAVKAYDAAIALDPQFAEAHGNRATIVAQAGYPEEALKGYSRALELDPTAAADWINRGALLHELGRFEAAIADYDKALTLAPDDASVLANRANALAALGRFEEADADFDRAIKRNPKGLQAYVQKAAALKVRGRFDEARALLDKARAIDPKDRAAAHAMAELMLLEGEWRAAWPLYEARTGRPELADAPAWKGEMPGGFRLVLVGEGRPSEMVLFARYAALMAGRGYDLTLLAPPALTPLLRSLPDVEQVVDDPEALKADQRRMVWYPLQSVMGLLPLSPDTVPDQGAYLAAEPERAAAWAGRLGTDEKLKVGVVWRDEFGGGGLPLAALSPLAEVPGVELIALQLHAPDAEMASVPFGARLQRPLAGTAADAAATAEAVLDMAAIIENLDVVVGIDALPVHIAGSLGKPVLLALPPVAGWHWLTDRADSPWYAGARLFRQPAPGDWAPVFGDIAETLRALQG